MAEPVTAAVGHQGREALADVLIAVADRAGAAARGAELHRRYPGLTLALVISGPDLVARFRDGTELIVAGATTGWKLDEAAAIAGRLYWWWLLRRRRAG